MSFVDPTGYLTDEGLGTSETDAVDLERLLIEGYLNPPTITAVPEFGGFGPVEESQAHDVRTGVLKIYLNQLVDSVVAKFGRFTGRTSH